MFLAVNMGGNEPKIFGRIDEVNTDVVGGKIEAVAAKQLRCLILLIHSTAIV